MSYNMFDFLSDEQDPKIVEKICVRMNDLFFPEEEPLYIAVQKKPAINVSPNSIVLTNKRLIIFRSRSLGFLMDFEEYLWQNVFSFAVKETIFGADFMFKTASGIDVKIDYLPRTQARKLYQISQLQKKNEEAQVNQESENIVVENIESKIASEVVTEDLHNADDVATLSETQSEETTVNYLQEEENNAIDERKSESLVIEETTDIEEIESVESVEIITSNAESHVIITKEEDPVATLQKLKYLLNNGLITQQDFDDKKAKILSRM